MKKGVVVVLMVAALAVLTTGVALAQSPEPPAPRGGGFGPGGMGRMGFGPGGEEGPLHEYMIDALAEALDIDPGVLESRVEDGEKPHEIALSLGFGADEIPALLSDARIAAFEAAAANGVIPEDQVEWMKSRPFGMGQGDCDGTAQGFGRGMGGGRFQQSNP